MSLYGPDHPNVEQSAQGLSEAIKEFIDAFGRSTLVFTKASALVNEHSYAASSESQELFHRLRIRGVMAITLIAPPPAEQSAAFIAFLNAESDDARNQGGASAYLRKHGVSLIVATDAVYASGDDADDLDGSPAASSNPDDMDRALGAAIDWLLKQDEEEDEIPRLPIADILSRPDEAAKLIREAVTKIHASRRHETNGEIASEVVHDLKDLAADDQDGWDGATPQIRKAMSKLPRDMRPEVAGFTEEDEEPDEARQTRTSHVADIFEVEAQVAEVLGNTLESGVAGALPAPDAFSSLFGASSCGLLSSWRRELQPGIVMGSSGKTLETLMTQETRGSEHERIARALSTLLPRAVEMKDFQSACAIADSLMRETKHGDPQDWRAVSARAALQGLDKSMLRQVVQSCAGSADSATRHIGCQLLEVLPDLALQMIDMLGSKEMGDLNGSLMRGISGCGPAAVGPLGGVLSAGSDNAKDLALDALTGLNTASAIREVGRALPAADDALAVRALTKLSTTRNPQVVDIGTELLNSRSSAVRCAALAALGELAVPASVTAIVRAASRRGMSRDDIAEKTAALQALGRIDCAEAREFLERTAKRQPLLGRRRYEVLRATAERVRSKMGVEPKAA